MYVIDFDTKELDGCELKDWLDKREVGYTETKKGYHYECGSVEECWHTKVVVSQIEIKTLTNTLTCSPILSCI